MTRSLSLKKLGNSPVRPLRVKPATGRGRLTGLSCENHKKRGNGRRLQRVAGNSRGRALNSRGAAPILQEDHCLTRDRLPMHIAIVTAGGAGMFCGSCMHDNTWARSLKKLGTQVTLLPTYTPLHAR